MEGTYATTLEAADPYCLRDGEAAKLLTGHPWHRFVVLGDSVAEGLGDPVDGYSDLPWCDRIAAELAAIQPDLVYRNLGERNLKAAAVRERQLAAALAFGPDLALVSAGGNDALMPQYQPDAVDDELRAMIIALRGAGALVLTVGLFDLSHCPAVPERFKPSLGARMREYADRLEALGRELGTLHIDLSRHPAVRDPAMYSADGLHGNLRSHAISAAEAVRSLGRHLHRDFIPT